MMYFTNPTTAMAIVAMAVSQFAPIMVAAAPVARSQADDLSSGQRAQRLNRQFQTVTVQDSCTGGETACIAGHFATCSPENDWEVSPCPKNLKCYAVPGAGKADPSTLCTTQDDATARIKDTGATGGINGDDSSDDANKNGGGGGNESSTTTTTTADVSGTPSASPTGTSATASSDIPKFNIPVGGDFSSILQTAVSTEQTTTSLPTATATPDLSYNTEYSSPVGDNLTGALPTQSLSETPCTTSDGAASTESGKSVILATTTVTVTPTDCATTGAPETSLAQGSGTAPYLVTFTTHSFSPIPESTPASGSGTLSSTAGGYSTADGYLTASPSATSAASSVAQTAPLYGTGGTTADYPAYPSGAAPSTTGSESTSSSDASIPPLAPAPTTPVGPVSVLPIHTIPA